MSTQVFAFAKITDESARESVYQSIKEGKSRFGMWDQLGSLRENYHGKNGFLLRIRKGDWLVHVNMPSYGKCVAVQTIGEYQYDDGLECTWGEDYNNFFQIDPDSLVEFDRNDPNIVPSVNLTPMRRGQRVLQVKDFLESIENIQAGRFDRNNEELKGLVHLRRKIEKLLPEIHTTTPRYYNDGKIVYHLNLLKGTMQPESKKLYTHGDIDLASELNSVPNPIGDAHYLDYPAAAALGYCITVLLTQPYKSESETVYFARRDYKHHISYRKRRKN